MTPVWHYRSALAEWAIPERAVAFTFGRHVFTKLPRSGVTPEIRRHEDEHVRQFQLYGIPLFLIVYVWWQIRYGYDRNPLEVEARRAALRA